MRANASIFSACVFENQDVKAETAMQLDREHAILGKCAGFEVMERLLALNAPGMASDVEVILLSQNSPDLSLRASSRSITTVLS
ncbi:5'-nucleotidase [Bradyrhizobium sp. Pear76]|nr:5'-nucleotidase [Bradyrhizobium oropedii]